MKKSLRCVHRIDLDEVKFFNISFLILHWSLKWNFLIHISFLNLWWCRSWTAHRNRRAAHILLLNFKYRFQFQIYISISNTDSISDTDSISIIVYIYIRNSARGMHLLNKRKVHLIRWRQTKKNKSQLFRKKNKVQLFLKRYSFHSICAFASPVGKCHWIISLPKIALNVIQFSTWVDSTIPI
jgi:hypothetical protein